MTPSNPARELLGFAMVIAPPLILTIEIAPKSYFTPIFFLGALTFIIGIGILFYTHNTFMTIKEIVAAPGENEGDENDDIIGKESVS